MQVLTLSEKDLTELIRRTALAVTAELRNDVQKPLPELMTKAELADYLRCDTSKINRYMKKGLPFEMFGGTPRFRKFTIDQWLRGQALSEAVH